MYSLDETDVHNDADSTSTQQQSDWSLVWECFENPHHLFNEGMSKAMQDLVKGALGEMRRYYSRKIVDVLVKVTRQSLDALRKQLSVSEQTVKYPVFVINAVLLIPKVSIQPSLEEVQEALVQAGKNITCVAKGVGQWTGGRPVVSYNFKALLPVLSKSMEQQWI